MYKAKFLHLYTVNFPALTFIYAGNLDFERSLELWLMKFPRFPCSTVQGAEVLFDPFAGPTPIDGAELQAELDQMQQLELTHLYCSSSACDSAAGGMYHTPLASTRQNDDEITLNFSSSPVAVANSLTNLPRRAP